MPLPMNVDNKPDTADQQLSLLGKVWHQRPADPRQALTFAQKFGVHDVLAQLLSVRKIPIEDIETFLAPSLKHQLPDPSVLKDMGLGVSRLITALQNDETIALFGDYDVDGGTSVAVLFKFLQVYTDKLLVHIPDRQKEGYGPNEQAIRSLQEKGAGLIIFMDCGTTAFDPLACLEELALDAIIIDHHKAEAKLPKVTALINPNRLDESVDTTTQLGHLAAVGLTFLFVVAVNRAMRQTDIYKEFDLMGLLDLVALGTVCDVVSLHGLNRAYVAQGLKVIKQTQNLGIQMLMQVAGITVIKSTYDFGFVLGPRLNAGGRLGQSDLAFKLLTTNDRGSAFEMASILDQNNQKRRALEKDIVQQAINQVQDYDSPLLVAHGDGWHPGVIGIAASRLQNKFYKPALVVAFEGDVGKGSGRSIKGLDLGAHILAAHQAGLLINGGGHEMAVGFSVHKDKFQDFQNFLQKRLAKEPVMFGVGQLSIDAALALDHLSLDLVGEVGKLAPFGQGHKRPLFMLSGVRCSYSKIVGQDHIACTLESDTKKSVQAISFGTVGTDLGKALQDKTKRLDVVGTIQIDTWQGNSKLKFYLEDARFS